MRSTFKVLFYVKKGSEKPNGNLPLMCRITVDGTRLVLAIDRKPIAEWFKEQFDKLRQNIRRPIQPQRKSRGMKI